MGESRNEIEELLYDYAAHVDLAEFKELGQMFLHGRIRADRGDAGVLEGPDAVEAFYRRTDRVHGDGTLRTRHQVTNVRIQIDDQANTARSQSYFVVLQATAELPLQPIVAGRYEDSLERLDGTWWFIDRMIHVDQLGNVSQHLDFDLGD